MMEFQLRPGERSGSIINCNNSVSHCGGGEGVHGYFMFSLHNDAVEGQKVKNVN